MTSPNTAHSTSASTDRTDRGKTPGLSETVAAGRYELPPLPFDAEALEPHISARTLSYHYDKHHQGYVDKLHDAVEGTPDAEKSLEDLIRTATGGLFNAAAQTWNHTFYWHSLSPNGGGKPSGPLCDALTAAFGSLDDFRREFVDAATGEFGSGWAWLILDEDDALRVVSTTDAESPLQSGDRPLLTLDVWEHAYYLDYQNDRNAYVERFLDHLVHWDFVEANLEKYRGIAA